MNANLDKIALELYGKIQTRFSNINIGDENAAVLGRKQDIPKARFFEFEYEENGESLGTITITLDADDGIVVQVSGDLVDDQDGTSRHGAYKFIRSFRQFAKDRLLNFDIQNIGKSNLDKRDYTFQAKRKEEPVMAQTPVMESKLYGTNKVSYQDLGEARLVIKHTQAVDANNPAGRTMHIEGIYIENSQGERFRYPYKHLNGARALAEHIKHGGTPYDPIGKHITSLSEELSGLRKFKGYVSRQEQLSEAMSSVTSRVMERIEEIKKTIQHLQRPAFYESFAEAFEASDEVMIPEEVQNDLIDRLTIRTFNEELKSVFPYIYKFVDESELPIVELSADDLLSEAPSFSDVGRMPLPSGNMDQAYQSKVQQACIGGRGTGMMFQPDPKDIPFINAERAKLGLPAWKGAPSAPTLETIEDQYESFMNDLIREDKDEIFSANPTAKQSAIKKLNKLFAQELHGGPEGINAIESLKGLIDDPEFLNSLRDIDPELDVRPLVQQFIMARDPDVAAQLEFGDSKGPADVEPTPPTAEPQPAAEPAPIEPTAAAPTEEVPPEQAAAANAAPAPVAEGKDEDPPFDGPYKKSKGDVTDKSGAKHTAHSQAKHLARQAMQSVIKKAKKAGATLETQLDFGDRVMTIAEMISECDMEPADVGFGTSEPGIDGMLKYVSGFYSKDEGNFPLGGMRVKIKVKKAFEDGEFGNASPEDLAKVLQFIDKKDPSGDVHGQEQHHVLKLAGVRPMQDECGTMPSFDISTIESQLSGVAESKGYTQDPALASIVHLAGLK